MIRDAKFVDIPAMIAVLEDAYAKSIYQDLGGIDRKEAQSYLMGAVQRHRSPNEGGTWVGVAETDGKVEGLLVGLLDRIYVVGSALRAIDVHYYGTDRASPRDMISLFDAWLKWAASVPKIRLITPTATHIVGDYSAAERLFEKRGFQRSGVIYERRTGP
jgi:hypothetical protein